MPFEDVKKVMETHVGELMALPGVVGVAVGALDDGTPCVQVLVAEVSDDLEKALPRQLGGHPVTIVETGEIHGMPGSNNP